MSRGHISARDVLRLAGPMTIALLSHTTMSVIDTIWVGQLGTSALAAVGLTTSLVFLVITPAYGIMDGVRVTTAHRTGAGEHDAARAMGWAGLAFAALAAVVAVLCIPVCTWAVGWLSDSPEVVSTGREFLSIRLLGAPFGMLSCAATAWFQGRGDTRTPMVASLLCTSINLVLDPLFIFGFGPVPAMGVGGAALATIIGMAAGASVLLIRLVPSIRGAETALRADGVAMWHLGSPIALRNLLEVGAYVGVAAMLAKVGAIHMAAHIMVVRLVSTSFLPGHAIAQACKVLVGQAVGAGDMAMAREAVCVSFQLALGVMGFMGVVFLAVPEPFLLIFGPEPDVLELAVEILVLAAFIQLLDAAAMVALGALEGGGHARFSMGITIAATWLIKLPIGVGCAVGLSWGAWGAWVGFAAELLVVAVVASWRVHRWLPRADRHHVMAGRLAVA